MPTLFTRIINGELPGRFVWKDSKCVAFLTIAPLATGHALVVPITEVDHWIDLPDDLAAHLWKVSQRIAKAQQAAFTPSRIGVLIAGEEVPHAHIHLIPFTTVSQLEIRNADTSPDPAVLDDAADRLRAALREAGHAEVSS